MAVAVVHGKNANSFPSQQGMAGFTLIELAIVLIIVGLVLGGVLVGRDLIEASRTRALINEIEKISTSIGAFKTKYNCYPGDCGNATQFWGVDPDGCPDGQVGRTTHVVGTCDGNGDGRIGYTGEWLRLFQQLGNAQLINGSYTGAHGSSSAWDVTPGVNVYKTGYNGAGISIYGSGTVDGTHPNNFPGIYNNSMHIGSRSLLSGTYYATWSGFMSPLSAASLDSKMDDGLPAQGKVMAHKNGSTWAPNCVTDNDPVTSRYNVNVSTPECSLAVRNVF